MIVEVQQGKVEGSKKNSIYSGREFYSFSGIPYAKPPVGDLRFRPPVPAEKWEGIRDATTEGNICTQLKRNNGTPVGSEDCLYLNVHTPEPPFIGKTLKPVIVYIHGGGYTTGSGSAEEFGPDYLMDYDVILVTLNYRLHILGFLNLNIPDCSGNYGLKDQGLALKWVRKNIQSFGGNPENITLTGESAGSVSVHYHTLSPASKGLFKRAIMNSGTATNMWAFNPNPTALGFRFANKLGLKTDDPQKVVDLLKNQTAETLVALVSAVTEDIRQEFPDRLVLLFAPSVELVGENKFITDTPAKMVQNRELIPLLFGLNSKEGIMKLPRSDDAFTNLNNEFTSLIRNNFSCSESMAVDIATKVKKHYFKDKIIGMDTLDEYVDLYTHMMFLDCRVPRDLILKTNAPQPVYEYEFSFDGKFNSLKSKMLLAKTIKGAGHADELGYLFFSRKTYPNPEFTESESEVIKNMCRIWTNFAKTGNPNPVDEKGIIEWKPSTYKERSYLRVSDTVEVVQGKIFGESATFWEEIFKNLEN